MSDKKYPFKFTIEFNRNIPQHIQAAEILNSLPRREKAEYLAKAVLSFEGKLEQGEGAVDMNTMKHMIRQILSEEFSFLPTKETESGDAETEKVVDLSEKMDMDNRDPDFLKNLSRSLATFRGQI